VDSTDALGDELVVAGLNRHEGHIVAMGGGGFSMEPDNPLLDDFVLGLSNRQPAADSNRSMMGWASSTQRRARTTTENLDGVPRIIARLPRE
jgi:hypothetical protein